VAIIDVHTHAYTRDYMAPLRGPFARETPGGCSIIDESVLK
jgi:hypothetical protein